MNVLNVKQYCGICIMPVNEVRCFDTEQYPFLNLYYENIIGHKAVLTPQAFCYECAALVVKCYKFKDRCLRGMNILYMKCQNMHQEPSLMKLKQLKMHQLETKLSYWTNSPRVEVVFYKRQEIKSGDHSKADDIEDKQTKKSQCARKYCRLIYTLDDKITDNKLKPKLLQSVKEEPFDNLNNTSLSKYGDLEVNVNTDAIINDIPIIDQESVFGDENKDFFDVKTEEPRKTETLDINIEFSEITEGKFIEPLVDQDYDNDCEKLFSLCTESTEVGKSKKEKSRSKISKRNKMSGKTKVKKKLSVNKKEDEATKYKFVTMTEEEVITSIEEKRNSASYKKAPFKCELCSIGFNYEVTLNNHMAAHSKSRGDYECKWCKRRFDTDSKMRQHSGNYHELKAYCQLCPYVTIGWNSARAHHLKQHAKVTYTCELCNKTFDQSWSYQNHRRRKHRSNCICPSCGCSFLTAKGLYTHYSRTCCKPLTYVSEEKDLYCDRCKLQFSTAQAFDNHKKHSVNHMDETDSSVSGHVKNRGRPTSCPVCGKLFSTRLACVAHCKTLHGGYSHHDRAICELCGASVTTPNMPAHKARHEGLSFQCNECHKLFTFKTNLVRHMRIHRNERRFQCEICSFKFHEKRSVDEHIKYVHMKVPYPKRERNKDRGSQPYHDKRMKKW